jgi:hypothetical protein
MSVVQSRIWLSTFGVRSHLANGSSQPWQTTPTCTAFGRFGPVNANVFTVEIMLRKWYQYFSKGETHVITTIQEAYSVRVAQG